MKFLLRLAFAAVLATSLGACAKNKKGAGADGAGVDGDYVSGTPLADRQEGVSFLSSNVDRNRFAPVYFGFDSHSVEGGERGKIDQVAQHLQSSGGTVIVAGFTDERGTPEYNRGLGERRAQAVREALIRAGADAGNIQTVSFGAEMPADAGSNESAWAKNRRAEFGVVR
ncbi:MAG TPA: OmpA family protein [Chthoniobacteraceae bacterium]|jgi:peptidoglycan-associated lipoprotein|nr:pal [Chthoniobacter sp.]HEV7869589.1 OmpA family protein [Chthoniobacteraceae bacterium]